MMIELYNRTYHIAAKDHKCCECHGIIHAGEEYEKVTALFEGQFDTFKCCCRCIDLLTYIENYTDTYEKMHGEQLEYVIDILDEIEQDHPEVADVVKDKIEFIKKSNKQARK